MNGEREGPDRRTFIGAAGGAVAAALAGCTISIGGPETKAVSQTRDPGDAEQVAVESVSGEITVTGTDRDDVRVDATVEESDPRSLLDDTDVEVTRADGTVTVAPTYDGFDPSTASLSVHLDVEVPADLPLASAETRNGDVTVDGTTGDATLDTTNGTVEATDVDGYLTASTTNGSVVARDVVGVAEADTTNGSVDVELRELRGDVALSSTNGSVTAAIPEGVDADVYMETTNGDARIEGLTLTSTTERSETEITGRLGDGGSELRLETTNGDVTLERLS